MKLFLSAPITASNKRYFPDDLLARLSSLGELCFNETGRRLTREETMTYLSDVDVVLTHWGSVQYDAEMLSHAPKLKMIAHCAGTVARIASEASYAKGIITLSANPVMCKYVAEWTLGVILNHLHAFDHYDRQMHAGVWHEGPDFPKSIYNTEIGLVGMGAIGRVLLDLLAPFGCPVKVYDPYINEAALSAWKNARLATFEEVMHSPIVSLHAAKTPETYHMINEKTLAMIPDGGLLINSARAALVDTEALIRELESGRISAVLDVFEREHCPQDARLLACKNVLLSPHFAAIAVNRSMTEAIIEDVERFIRGEKLQMEVGVETFHRMTQE